MDLLNILVNPNKINNVCFLCYKNDESSRNIYENIELVDECFNLNITLWNMMKILFPMHDILLPQACEDCSNLIIKFFSLMQKNYLKNEIINSLVDNINDEVDNKIDYSNQLKKKYKINVIIPSLDTIPTRISLKKVSCKKCNMKFKSKMLLQKHVNIVHKNLNKSIVCDICGKSFDKTATLKAHLLCHKEKQCPHCFKILKSHSHFKVHLKNHKAGVKRTRTTEKYYCCERCDYRSLAKDSLIGHINKVHLNIRPYVCILCKKGFYRKSNLTDHVLTHSNIKEKVCDICGDTFMKEKALADHMMLHSGKKPFKCDICGAEFITSGRRLEHVKRSHMEKTECCKICYKKFALKKELNKHVKVVHGAEKIVLEIDEKPTDLIY